MVELYLRMSPFHSCSLRRSTSVLMFMKSMMTVESFSLADPMHAARNTLHVSDAYSKHGKHIAILHVS